jgi:ribosomal-protein-alanine N-acetyltransferase
MKMTLEFQLLGPPQVRELTDFFREIVVQGDDSWFHPHSFTAQDAERICAYQGDDMFFAACMGPRIVGYGLLRGWDEGFVVPSLGIIVRRGARGQGIGSDFMHFLHSEARSRGAKRIRLKVYKANRIAIAMYRALGYRFEAGEGEEEVGYLDLENREHSSSGES